MKIRFGFHGTFKKQMSDEIFHVNHSFFVNHNMIFIINAQDELF